MISLRLKAIWMHNWQYHYRPHQFNRSFFNYFRKSRAARMLDLQQYKPNLIIMHAHELHT